MKKILCILSLLLIAINKIYGNDYSVILENEFGAIKADMARKACAIADYKGNNMDKITNESIYAFLNSLDEEQNATLHNIIHSFNLPSKGAADDIDSYKTKLLNMNEAFKRELLKKYPKKKNEINIYYEGFIHRINNLFTETKSFMADSNPDKSAYIDMYPHGIYVSLLEQNNIVAADVEETVIVQPVKESIDDDFQEETEGNDFYKWAFWVLVTLITILAVAYFFIKKDKKEESATPQKPIEDMNVKIVKKQTTVLQSSVGDEGDVQTGNMVVKKHISSQMIVVDDNTAASTDQEHQPTPKIEKEIPSHKETNISEVQKSVSTKDERAWVTRELAGDDTKKQIINKPIQREGADPKKWETAFANFSEESVVVGVSAQGRNHVSGNIPCQDCCCYKALGEGWGIAAVSDGAGSAKLSHEGSHLVVEKVVYWLERIIQKYQLIEKNVFPTQESWSKKCIEVMNQIALDQQEYAQKKDVELKYLNCTLIVVIHSPLGLLVTHIGDGRAGFKNQKGEWISIMTPHKGEECNQTYFLPYAIKSAGNKSVNGVILPESRVIKDQVSAIVLMTDGLEHTFWNCIQQDKESGKYRDVNVPVAKAFNVLASRLHKDKEENKSVDVVRNEWFEMIKNNFPQEGDDKTLLLISFE